MKKIILLIVVGVLLISGFGAGGLNLKKESEAQLINIGDINGPKDYTHTVLVECGMRSGCPACPQSNAAWKSIYAGGNYDFEYVALIYEYNTKARQRFYSFNPAWVPTSYFDGGQYVCVGTDYNTFYNYLDACGSRSVPDLVGEVSAMWLGDAKIDISISVENNDNNDYSGTLRVYVVELISPRWKDYTGQPYGHALLDFPWEQSIDIDSGDTLEDNKVWDGAVAGYSDIEPDNIQVILSVFDDTPHTQYSDPPDGNPFNAYYADETVATLVLENEPPEKPVITGPTSCDPETEIEYTFTAEDPDDDDLLLWIDWDDTTEGWLGPYPSGEPIYVNHAWSEKEIYEITAKVKDENDQESEWADHLIVYVGNFPPTRPEIDGPKNGKINTEIEFTFVATDPNNDELNFYIEWGDGNIEEWIGPYDSGEEVKRSHSWNKEKSFGVKAKVRDPDGEESDLATHVITIPRTKYSQSFYIIQLFERFSSIFQIIKNILG